MKNKLLLKTINKLVDSSFKDGRILEPRVVKSIKALKTLPSTDAILALSEYLKGIKRMERKHTMYLETAISLSPAQIQKAKKIIDKKIKITKVKVNINPEILGGFKLRVGDEIWDQSILGKVNQIKEAISDGGSN